MRGAQLEQIEELGGGHRKGDAPFLCFWILRIEGRLEQLCTKGFRFTTYSSQRDFCIIILVAILLYFAMLTGKSLYKAKLELRGKQI